MRNTRARSVAAGLLSLALLAGACGDDDDTEATAGDEETTETTEADSPTETTEAEGEAADGEMTALDVTLTADGLDGVPEEFAGGAVEVSFTNETDEENGELNFTRVAEGTTAEQFAEEFAVVFEGGAFPEFALANAGVGSIGGETYEGTILLEPGPHVVWYEKSTGEGEQTEIMGVLVEVTEGAEAELPQVDGEIVARDYGFDVDVSGPGTITFRNDGPDQHHHALVVDFGTNPPEVVEQAIGPLLMSEEDAPPPDIEGFDMEQVNFEFAGSGVFGPELGGTFEADFTEGNTYGVVCFISDRAGGPPHAIGMEMFEVFQV